MYCLGENPLSALGIEITLHIMDEIKLTEKEYRELYEGWISKALKTESEIMGEYSDRERELLYKYIDFTYQILATLGIFAGFGFTAISSVQTLSLFILGETLLIAPILYGLVWLKKFYDSNLEPLQNSSRDVFNIYKRRDEIFLDISSDFLTKQTLLKENLINAQKIDQEVLNWIREHSGEEATKKEIPPHKTIFVLAIAGLVFIFLSFLFRVCIKL